MLPHIPPGGSFKGAEAYYLQDLRRDAQSDDLTYVFDKDGNAVPEPDLIKWAQSCTIDANRILQYDILPGDIVVSTIFLGIADRHHRDDDQPVFWGTLINGGLHDGYEERYITRTEAVAGHQIALKLAREGVL